MSVWRDMARDAGMEPTDQAAAWIEETERRRHEDQKAADDSFCEDCQKWLSDHEHCPNGCGHYACDCICGFLRDEWPTHPSNPDAEAPF